MKSFSSASLVGATLVLQLLSGTTSAVREIRFVSPLQSLTIPDPELLETVPDASSKGQGALETPRRRFLPRFLAGLKAEDTVRQKLAVGQIKVPDRSRYRTRRSRKQTSAERTGSERPRPPKNVASAKRNPSSRRVTTPQLRNTIRPRRRPQPSRKPKIATSTNSSD